MKIKKYAIVFLGKELFKSVLRNFWDKIEQYKQCNYNACNILLTIISYTYKKMRFHQYCRNAILLNNISKILTVIFARCVAENLQDLVL